MLMIALSIAGPCHRSSKRSQRAPQKCVKRDRRLVVAAGVACLRVVLQSTIDKQANEIKKVKSEQGASTDKGSRRQGAKDQS